MDSLINPFQKKKISGKLFNLESDYKKKFPNIHWEHLFPLNDDDHESCYTIFHLPTHVHEIILSIVISFFYILIYSNFHTNIFWLLKYDQESFLR